MDEGLVYNIICNALKWYREEHKEILKKYDEEGRKHTFDYAIAKGMLADIETIRGQLVAGKLKIRETEGGKENGTENTDA